MGKYNRDLLVLFNKSDASDSLNKEVESLNTLLYSVEKLENICISHEVIDVNKYKIFTSKKMVIKALTSNKLKHFVFLNNLN